MDFEARAEDEIFSDLERLCISPGYAHAIAYLCFRDNIIKFGEELTTKSVLQQFSMERLVRTEMSTLIGLMCKSEIDFSLPSADVLQEYVSRTDSLLQEIHRSMLNVQMSAFDPELISQGVDPFDNGMAMREPIFYGGESAYAFQYRDFLAQKYMYDNDWFIANKGYSVEQLVGVVRAVSDLQNIRINETLNSLVVKSPDEWTILPGFMFSASDIADLCVFNVDVVRDVLNSFCLPNGAKNAKFSSLGDFNLVNAYPLICVDSGGYLLYQHYGLVEAMYETPFFWFLECPEYKDLAMEHRGRFAEDFVANRLASVFGSGNVYKNVNVTTSNGTVVGEIDVLVVFARRAIVVQAKSKKLTIAARKGNDNCIRDDFKMAIQDSYDQGFSCSEFLLDDVFNLVGSNGELIKCSRDFIDVFIFCVVSDHYPALSFQSRQFLKYQTTDVINAPFVMDVFLVDVLAEMLCTPLHFLSYIKRRALYSDKVMATHELTTLSYHLKQNLWVDGGFNLIHLADDICADLDLAMMVRREGLPGKAVPDGVLTKYAEGTVGRLLKHIESLEEPSIVELGFLLLSLSGETVDQVNKGVDALVAQGRKDNSGHDLTVFIGDGGAGITIHCNDDSDAPAALALKAHCLKRKYFHKAKFWYGLCVSTQTGLIRFAAVFDEIWKESDDMNELVQGMAMLQRNIKLGGFSMKGKKLGRNDKCPCGSDLKYKKCCMKLSRR